MIHLLLVWEMEPRNPHSAVFFFFCFVFFFVKTKFTVSGAYLWHGSCKILTRMVVFAKCLYLLYLQCGRKISCFLEKVSAGNKMIIWSLSMYMTKVCWSPILFIYFLSPFESFVCLFVCLFVFCLFVFLFVFCLFVVVFFFCCFFLFCFFVFF